MDTASPQKAWTTLLELMLYGFLIRSGQLAMILLALQFSQIFTNPAQIIFLFPIAAAVILILGLLTLVEIECNRYVGALDKRLNVITSYTNHQNSHSQQNYLEKTILPVALNILSLPTIFIFLWWTSSYLFSILLISTIISGVIIFRFNSLQRKVVAPTFPDKKADFNSGDQEDLIPLYLIRNFENTSTTQNTKKLFAQQNLQKNNPSSMRVRKRKILSFIRQSTRVIMLVTAVVLAVFNLTGITQIAGFLIIGNVFRSGCLAVIEFMSSTPNIFPLGECIQLLTIALIENDSIEKILIKKNHDAYEKRLNFNQKYSSLIENHPYLRLKNVSAKDVSGSIITSNITSRILIQPITFIRIESNGLAIRLKSLLNNYINNRLTDKDHYLINGEVFLGRKKLSEQFFNAIPIYDPTNNYILSLDIYDYFDESSKDELKKLMNQNNDLSILLDSIVNTNIGIDMHSPRQINQFRAILQLIIIYLEPSCICVLIYCFDSFEPIDTKTLIDIFEPAYREKSINVIALLRNQLPEKTNCTFYNFTSNTLSKQSSHA